MSMKKIILTLALMLSPLQAVAQYSHVQVDLSVLDGRAPAQAAPTYASNYGTRVVEPLRVQTSAAPLSDIYEPVIAPVAEAAAVKPVVEPAGLWGAKWSGRANLGASIQTGNSDTQNIDADAKTKADWGEYRAEAGVDYEREEDSDVKTVDNRRLYGLFDYFFAEKWFANANIEFEQDDIAELDLRSTYGVGIGHQPFDTDDLKLKYTLGPSLLTEERTNGDTEDSLAYNWHFDYEQKFWDGNVQFFHNHRLLVPSDETSQYLLDTATGVRVPLRTSLVATFEVEHDIDKSAPTGTDEEDTKYGLKLGYEW